MMREEYSKLGKSLFFFYMTRMLTLAIIFFASFSYVNDFLTNFTDVFPNSAGNIPYDRMANIVELSTSAIQSISQTSLVILGDSSNSGMGNYCTQNQSFSNCYSFLFNSLDNQLIYSTYGIYTSYACTQGDCTEISTLWDYFWTFKIRLHFIDYLVLQYSLNGSQSERLVAPACSNETINFDFGNTSQWKLAFTSGILTLSRVFLSSQAMVKVAIVFKGDAIRDIYHISLSDYDFPANSQTFQANYITYSQQGINLFGYLPKAQHFVLNVWVYSLHIFLACTLCVVPMFHLVSGLIKNWEQRLFKHMLSLDNLYKYQINTIFEGDKPKKSVILNETLFTYFYEDLSEIVDKDCEPLLTAPPVTQRQQTFKFTALIDRVMAKFEQSLKPLQQQRGRQFSNLKPLIRSSIAQISESVDRKLRDLFVKSRQLMITSQFFHFGYLAILQPISFYQELLANEKTPLPDALLTLFRYMNHTINSGDLKFAFKFAFAYNHIIEQQIIMRLQDQLLPKYIDSLRNLDVMEPTYRQKLGLSMRIADLDLIIQNKRHISAVYLK